jgi:predicted PurR-regulated permease PerM
MCALSQGLHLGTLQASTRNPTILPHSHEPPLQVRFSMAQPSAQHEKPSPAASTDLTIMQVLKLVALGLLLIGCFVVLKPFLSSLMWSIVLCFSSWPVYSRLLGALHGRKTLAAALMTLCTVLVLFAPFAIIGISLAEDVKTFASSARHALDSPPPPPPGWVERLPLIGSRASQAWRELGSGGATLLASLRRLIEPATSWLLGVSVQFVQGLAELALSIFIAFFLFRDGTAVAQRFVDATESIVGSQAGQLVDLAGKTVRGVVYGILGTALAQSVIAGIGFVIAGVPGAGLLALITFFMSVLPVGPPLVWIPTAVWLFSKGSIGWGIFMLCWGMLVSSVDNVIKPMIISQGSRMPFVLILLGVLGGAIAFGLIGVFLGPTLLAVGFRLLEQFKANRTPITGR